MGDSEYRGAGVGGNAPWQIAPAFSEQIYTMEDALLFAGMMMNFLRYSDRVKLACQSLLTNISACIMQSVEAAYGFSDLLSVCNDG